MRWSNLEVDNVLYLLKSGKKYKEISTIINRSVGSIRNKMNEFNEKSSNYKEIKDDLKCLNCNKEFSYDKDRIFCSKSCSATFNNKMRVNEKIKCLNCNKETNRRNKYCSNKCQGLHKRNIIFDRIKNGDTTLNEKNYKSYLIYNFGEKCMKCGWCEVHQITGKAPIQLEHKDGDSSNNRLENLELLCPNCHSLTLTYGALNKGRGRKNRKI
jgi:hypothetical protein